MQCYIDCLGFAQKSLYTLLFLSQIVVILSLMLQAVFFIFKQENSFISFFFVCACVIMLQLTHFHK